jgi:hypothetical protein
MSTTLARRIRRIGLLPTTYKEVHQEQLVRNDEGKEVAKTVVLHRPKRHREDISAEARGILVSVLRAEYRKQNAEFRKFRRAVKAKK